MKKPEVEIVEGDTLVDEESVEEEGKKKVATSCPRTGCESTTAYLIGNRRTGPQVLSGAGMNLIQYSCVKCGHTWSLSY